MKDGLCAARSDAENLVKAIVKHGLDIEKALCYGRNSYTIRDLVERVVQGSLIMHSLPRSVVFCEIVKLPQYRLYNIMIAAGDLQDIKEHIPMFEIDARAHKCKHMSFTGRMGWIKALQGMGWEDTCVTAYKEVSDEQVTEK